METSTGGGMRSVVTVLLLLVGSVVIAAEGGGVGRPCFDACFDQCVSREEFWFCQFFCYRRCSGGRAAATSRSRDGGDCEQSCVLSMCGQLHPDSKMMAVCQDTCGKSYAVERCRLLSRVSTSSAM